MTTTSRWVRAAQNLAVVAGCYGLGTWFGHYLGRTHNPMDSYDPLKDEDLQCTKADLLDRCTNVYERKRIEDHFRVQKTGDIYLTRWMHKVFGRTSGYPTFWYDSEKHKHARALVRADGKILSDIDYGTDSFWPLDTVLSARVVDGYLEGVDECCVYFPGKGRYKPYQFEE
jgi:hypothetical protein